MPSFLEMPAPAPVTRVEVFEQVRAELAGTSTLGLEDEIMRQREVAPNKTKFQYIFKAVK
jgi:phosphoribosylcarboxyaminoimidazole (NCAIR) mutase